MKIIMLKTILLFLFTKVLGAQEGIFLRFENFENFELNKQLFKEYNLNVADIGFNDSINKFIDIKGLEIDENSDLFKHLNKKGVLGLITSNFTNDKKVEKHSKIQFYYYGKLCDKTLYKSHLIGFSKESNIVALNARTGGKTRGVFRLQLMDNKLKSIVSMFYELNNWDIGLQESSLRISHNEYHYFTNTIYRDLIDDEVENEELKNYYTLDKEGHVQNLMQIEYDK